MSPWVVTRAAPGTTRWPSTGAAAGGHSGLAPKYLEQLSCQVLRRVVLDGESLLRSRREAVKALSRSAHRPISRRSLATSHAQIEAVTATNVIQAGCLGDESRRLEVAVLDALGEERVTSLVLWLYQLSPGGGAVIWCGNVIARIEPRIPGSGVSGAVSRTCGIGRDGGGFEPVCELPTRHLEIGRPERPSCHVVPVVGDQLPGPKADPGLKLFDIHEVH